MRKLLSLTIALICLTLLACETEGTLTKKIVVTSPTNVEIGLYEGEFIIEYSIMGIEDVDATITTTSDWLRIKENKGGKATILYTTNDSGGIRQAAITLSYESSKANVIVTQSNEATTPILTLTSDENVNIDRCGQKVVISYTLENSNPTQ